MERLTKRFQEKGMEQQEIMHNGHRWGPAFFPGNGYKEYSDLLERLAAYEDTGLTPEEIPRWVPVGERLPDIGTPVICYCNNSRLQNLYQRVGYWGTDRSWHDSWDGREIPVTHWMPLPEPPKEPAEAEKERQDDAEH